MKGVNKNSDVNFDLGNKIKLVYGVLNGGHLFFGDRMILYLFCFCLIYLVCKKKTSLNEVLVLINWISAQYSDDCHYLFQLPHESHESSASSTASSASSSSENSEAANAVSFWRAVLIPVSQIFGVLSFPERAGRDVQGY